MSVFEPSSTDDGKDEFTESVQFIPENFADQQDALPPEYEPEIEDKKREEEAPAVSSDSGEAVGTEPPADEKKKAEGETDEQPQIDPVKIAAELEEVKRKLDKAEARAGYWQRQAEKKPPETPADESATELKKPQYEDFKTDAEYLEALADYKVEVRLREQDAQKRKAEQNEAAATRDSWVSGMMADGVASFADFEEIVTDQIVPLTVQVLDAVRSISNENASHAEIVYYLGKNIRETAKISRLTPEAQAREIGAIAEKIAADKERIAEPEAKPEQTPSPPKPEVKRATAAPAPINPVRGGSSAVFQKDPDKMTNEEYRAWRSRKKG